MIGIDRVRVSNGGPGMTTMTVGPEVYREMDAVPLAGDVLVAHVRRPEIWTAPSGWTVKGVMAWRRLVDGDTGMSFTFSGATADGFEIDLYLMRSTSDDWLSGSE